MSNATAEETMQAFLTLSSELCGFSEFTLLGTGYADGYFTTVMEMAGAELIDDLLAAYHELPAGDPATRDRRLRADILSDDRIGPVARNIIKLWYTSIWFELPTDWHAKYQTLHEDRSFIPFTYAYPEGLLGPAVGAHVQGAKPTGYGSWKSPPEPLEFEGDLLL